MPVVFIHGVSTRKDAEYDANVRTRDAFLRQMMLPAVVASPENVAIISPYWGDEAGKMHWNYACLPSGDIESLGPADVGPALLVGSGLADVTARERVLTDMARSAGLPEVVDVLWALAWTDAAAATPAEEHAAVAKQLAALGARAVAYAQANPKPAWLADVPDDVKLVARLMAEAGAFVPSGTTSAAQPQAEWETLGGGDVLNFVVRAGMKVGDSVKNVIGANASKAAVGLWRPALQHHASDFLGDVFAYLKKRGTKEAPGPIVTIVAGAIAAAAAVRTDSDPLIVIGHSMGGDIAYDIFSHFRPDLRCDVFCTVGSQVGLFEELKLFEASNDDVPANGTRSVERPPNVGRWINVFDSNDVLAFATKGVFSGTEDFRYATGRWTLEAHSAYFRIASFYDRLGKHIGGAPG
jgi:hypothetical protein